jgi:hypothetical protein
MEKEQRKVSTLNVSPGPEHAPPVNKPRCQTAPLSPDPTPNHTRETIAKLIQQETLPQISNLIYGLSYRIITIEESNRKKIHVEVTQSGQSNIPNVVIRVPPEPTTVLHMPQNQALLQWLTELGAQVAPPVQTAPSTDPKGPEPTSMNTPPRDSPLSPTTASSNISIQDTPTSSNWQTPKKCPDNQWSPQSNVSPTPCSPWSPHTRQWSPHDQDQL